MKEDDIMKKYSIIKNPFFACTILLLLLMLKPIVTSNIVSQNNGFPIKDVVIDG